MKVSVLTQIHNRLDLFAETMRSVLNQTYPFYEFIIIDDGSTEDVKTLVEGFHDERLKYFPSKRIGNICKLRNLALSKATGEVVAFIDSDDLWHEDKLKLHVEDMISSNCVISFSDCQLFDENGSIGPSVCKKMHKQEVVIFNELVQRNQTFAFGTNLFFKRIVNGEALKFDEKLFVGEHDLITLTSARHKATYIDQVLNQIRRHDRNTSQEHSIISILSPLEYNHTANKLLKERLITNRLYKKIKASNYSKVALCYVYRGRLQTGTKYLTHALLLDFTWSYFKFFLKLSWRRIVGA